MSKRDFIKLWSEKNHGWIHFALGSCVGVLFSGMYGYYLPFLFLVAVIGAFLPDIDHLVYLFTYGKDSNYSIEARQILFQSGFAKYIEYCKENHKNNTGIVSHNMLTVFLMIFLALYFQGIGNVILMTLFWSMSFHFIFDMSEDLIFFGKLNGNWWLRFNKSRDQSF